MVEIPGRDLPELFANACGCLFDAMTRLERIEEHKSEPVELESADLSELFLDWLRELLFRFSTSGFVPARADVILVDEGPPARLRAELHGERYDRTRHGLKLEVKTPTYHRYRLEKTESGYRAVVVLDV